MIFSFIQVVIDLRWFGDSTSFLPIVKAYALHTYMHAYGVFNDLAILVCTNLTK